MGYEFAPTYSSVFGELIWQEERTAIGFEVSVKSRGAMDPFTPRDTVGHRDRVTCGEPCVVGRIYHVETTPSFDRLMKYSLHDVGSSHDVMFKMQGCAACNGEFGYIQCNECFVFSPCQSAYYTYVTIGDMSLTW